MDVQSFLPLTEPTFFILLVLAPGPQHGYAIMKETAVLSDARVQLSTSTLYGAIKRLLDQGWIERAEAASGVENGRNHAPAHLHTLEHSEAIQIATIPPNPEHVRHSFPTAANVECPSLYLLSRMARINEYHELFFYIRPICPFVPFVILFFPNTI